MYFIKIINISIGLLFDAIEFIFLLTFTNFDMKHCLFLYVF